MNRADTIVNVQTARKARPRTSWPAFRAFTVSAAPSSAMAAANAKLTTQTLKTNIRVTFLCLYGRTVYGCSVASDAMQAAGIASRAALPPPLVC